MQELETLTITEFGGPLTRRMDGPINSGKAKYDTSWGYDPYSKPGNLTWLEQPTSILTIGTGAIVATDNYYSGQSNFLRIVDSNSSLYSLTVSNGSNPELDTSSVIGAIPGANTYTTSGAITRFGATTERLFVGGDSAIGRCDIDGANPSIVADVNTSNFNTNRPRPMAQFLGKIYFGNGNNIGEIDSTNTCTTTTKLSPGFPYNTYVQDLDVTPDGNYLVLTVNDTLLGSSGFDGNDSTITENRIGTSRKLYWNGSNTGFTAQEQYGGLSIFSNVNYGDKDYAIGYDLGGAAIFKGTNKELSLPKVIAPYPSAAFSTSNMLSFVSPEFDPFDSKMKTSFFQYGQYDSETPDGLFRLLKYPAQIRNDVKSVPTALNVDALIYASSIVGATNHIGGTSKVYFSTVESNAQAPAQLIGKLYKFSLNPIGARSVLAGVYETQNQLFSKKIAVKEVRLYTDPLSPSVDFNIDLIGSGGSIMSGGSHNFTTIGASSVATGTDVLKYNPACAPTYSLGVRISNASVTGTNNWTATKLELDIVPAGK